MRELFRLALLALVGTTVTFAQIHFTAQIDGAQEVPPVAVTATGTGSFTLSSDLTQLKWTVTYQGLSGTLSAAHFHTGPIGIAGPVVKPIAGSGGAVSATLSGTWTSTDATAPLTEALVESLLTGRVYINFHTSAHPGGEVRGQLVLETGLHFTASISGAQENPPVAGIQGGTGAFTLDPTRTKMQWDVSYRDLSGSITAAHFHTADSGSNGPVVRNISAAGPAAATLSGVWASTDASQPLTAALVDSLMAGRVYVNFHTSTNPGGEMRGQLRLNGGVGFVARLNNSQENPPTVSSGTGTGSFSMDDSRTSLTYEVTYINLTGTITGGHFHAADSGRNGPVVRPIGTSGAPASSTVSGVWRSTDSSPLTPALAESLLTGRAYVNFHTSANPGGEIRGQVFLATGIGFTCRVDGSQENPPVSTAASGTGSVVINARRDTVKYSSTYQSLSGTLTAAHFHTGPIGVNGPVVKAISGSGPASGSVSGLWTTLDPSQPLTRALADSILAGKTYINFHTALNPGGEMRGQVRFGSDVATDVRRQNDAVPSGFALEQNYPNPFNPSTAIRFNVVKGSHVTLTVFDILGREVATLVNQSMTPGSYSVEFNAGRFASGVYIYRLATDAGFTETRKMLLLR